MSGFLEDRETKKYGEGEENGAEAQFEECRRHVMSGGRTDHDPRDRTEQEPLGRFDHPLADVVRKAVARAEDLRRPAPIAWNGERPTTNMKNGRKNSAPETPGASATNENSIDAGNTHQWARNRSTGNPPGTGSDRHANAIADSAGANTVASTLMTTKPITTK